FCHNALLVTEIDPSTSYKTEDVLAYLKTRKGLLDGVAVTGGEPLLMKDIEGFISELKEMGYSVKLDTNGSFPDKLKDLVNKKLVDYVAIDVKNSPERYAETIGVKNFDLSPVRESFDFLLSGAVDYEFRTTVVKEFHTVDDIIGAAKSIRGAKRYFLQNFVDSGNLIENGLHAVDKDTLFLMRDKAREIIPTTETRGV
ncbi:MAG: anaerobic ribonucleoside-triphosphate reductase activating protein, partial [Clostridia bacterium]|nr:anaerobic ribonucleoside-triphosphate reductase activating protein [Clostridia bacterium]